MQESAGLRGVMDERSLVNLLSLMALSRGNPEVIAGVIDGPVATGLPELAAATFRSAASQEVRCSNPPSLSCRHGTSITGILASSRQSDVPGIAPDCAYWLRPVFLEDSPDGEVPAAALPEVAEAIGDCVRAGAHIINLSIAVSGISFDSHRLLRAAMEYARQRGVLVIAAVGNQRSLGGGMDILRHVCTIPVVAYSTAGQPLPQAHIAASIGRFGLGAPGRAVVGLASTGGLEEFSGTSIAAPFVTGAALLLRCIYPTVAAQEIKHALIASRVGQQRSVIPGLLNAWAASQVLSRTSREVSM